MNALAYASSPGAASASGGDETQMAASNQAPQWGGSGANFRVTQTMTGNTNTNGILSGDKWGGTTLTFSFPTLASQYEASYGEGNEPTNNFFAATNGIKDGIRYAMNLLSQYTNMVTTEVAGSASADVRVAGSFAANPTAYAYYPGDYTQAGDVWYGSSYTSYNTAIKGQYEWATSLHELGHALGLKHGHAADNGGNQIVMETAFDQMAYSVMTYRSYVNAPLTGYTNELNGYAQTFMMYDIAALQTMYGANFNTNSGNSTYTWSATTGEMFINGVGQGAPGGNRIFMTIWDGNGVDTYDFSNYSTNLTVDLTPGSFNITSAVQLSNLGGGNTAPGNIFNALQFNGDVRSLIENANGGSGNDTITGNAADNVLNGGAGNDIMYGGNGNDTLIGGSHTVGGWNTLNGGFGIDTVFYSGETNKVYADLSQSVGYIDAGLGFVFSDSLNLFENITSGSGNDTLIGDNNANVLNGAGGNDTMFGKDGNDTMIGGGHNLGGYDIMYGEGGIDTASFTSMTGRVYADLLTGSPFGVSYVDTGSGFVHDSLLFTFENLTGGSGNDILLGDGGANTLNGSGGNDFILGQGGADTIIGGEGNDSLYGDAGNDFFIMDAGLDIATGGADADVFLWKSRTQGADVVSDFSHSQGDKIYLDHTAFGVALGLTLTLGTTLKIGAGATASTGSATVIFDTSTNILWFDIDGTGGQAKQAITFLSNGATGLAASDFVFS